jgi:hypothetical protein
MKNQNKPFLLALILSVVAILNVQLSAAFAQGTAFNYNGQLNVNGAPANGSYDVAFSLFATNSGGNAVAGPVTNSATGVTNGLFAAIIDFGSGVFTGSNYWLQVAVRTNGSGSFTNLLPRQQILPTPYAIYSANAGSAATANTATTASSANSVSAVNISGTIPLAQLPGAVITNDSASLTIGGTNFVAPLTVPPTVPTAATGLINIGETPNCVTVAGCYAYVVNAYSNTLQIIDVTVASAPVSVGLVGTEGFPVSVAVAGRYAYVACGDGSSGAFQIFDVSNPSAPVNVGSVGTGLYPISVEVAGNYAYVLDLSANTLKIFDVSNPSAPVVVGSVGTGVRSYSVAVAGRYAYVVSETSDTLQIFDISNPSAPISVGSVGTGSFPTSVAVVGRYAYVANSESNTLQIVDITNPSAPVSVGLVGTDGGPFAVAVAGRYAFVANNAASTLQILDVSNPSVPVSVGSVGTGSEHPAGAIAGELPAVVITNDCAEFDHWRNQCVAPLTVPPNVPSSAIGSVGTGNLASSVAVAGRYAYVVNNSSDTLQIFDVSTPSAPVSVGSVPRATGQFPLRWPVAMPMWRTRATRCRFLM